MNDLPEKSCNALAFIGLGRVGLNLLRLAYQRGLNIPAGWDPDPNARNAARSIVPTADFPDCFIDLTKDVDTLIVAVPDPLLPALTKQLVPLLEHNPGCLVACTSGTVSSQDLAILNASGALYGTMHPIQSFHNNHLPKQALTDIGCGIEGNEHFRKRASALAVLLGWKPVEIGSEEKMLYHTACVMAGNFITVLAADAGKMLARAASRQDPPIAQDRAAGQDRAAAQDILFAPLLRMMRTVLERLETESPASALTGPASRGDVETIELEVRLLSEHYPEFAQLYIECTKRAVALAEHPEAKVREIENVLRKHSDPK